MDNKPLVSIVMPAYNCEKHVIEAINSVLGQTYQNWELIVIDDGSKDNTLEVIKSFGKKDERIKAQANEQNIGVAATRNRGVELAKGDWIAFLDSDDMWKPTKLEKQLDVAKQKSAEFLFTGSAYVNENSESYKGTFEVPMEVSYKKLLNQNVISCSSVLIKKGLIKNVKMERDDLHEDYITWLRILKTGIAAHGINEPLLIYRISSDSKSGDKLKSAKMTYKVYRYIGLNPGSSSFYLIKYAMASVRKYKKINAN